MASFSFVDLDFDIEGVLAKPMIPVSESSSATRDAGFVVHYGDLPMEGRLQRLRIGTENSNESTLSSTETDQLERVSARSSIPLEGNEEVEIQCDGLLLRMKELTTDQMRSVGMMIACEADETEDLCDDGQDSSFYAFICLFKQEGHWRMAIFPSQLLMATVLERSG